ncbi:MAG: glycosyltransferase family 2 protein [Thermoleophilaceae bacterium]|nr:glycosyltransferase family 2 protein [Thermoleophilaceae bacterium]
MNAPTELASPAVAERPATETIDVSVVIPCLNEAEGVGVCVEKAIKAFEKMGVVGEVVVSDNGSTDGSPEIAEAAGARVVHESRPGYGSAYLAGFAAAKGNYIVMGDADDTYDFSKIDEFVALLDEGNEMVIGNRMGNIQPGAMPWLHQYVGNPILTRVLNIFFRSGVKDAHCGMRAFRRDALDRLKLRTPGMEFASEMVLRSSKAGLKVAEIDIDYHPRIGDSKLNTFSDGWRHLRFLLIHSPTHLFIAPGIILAALGALMMLVVLTGFDLFGRSWDLHAMTAGAFTTIIGSQIISLGLSAKAYGVYHLGEEDALHDRFDGRIRLEHGLLAGLLIAFIGAIITLVIVISWIQHDLGSLNDQSLLVFSMTLVVLGMQVIFTSFFMSIVGMHGRDGR